MNMADLTQKIMTSGHKVQSKNNTKHDRIVHLVYELSLVHRLISLTNNYTNQVIELLLLILRNYETLKSNCLTIL